MGYQSPPPAGLIHRERDAERGHLIFAGRSYGAAVEGYDLLCDRQSQAGATGVGASGLVQPEEFFKNGV